MNLSANLKRLRKSRDITQEELASVLGISFQSVSKWERGDGYPDISLLPGIARFFDTTVDELLGVNEDKLARRREEIYNGAMSLANSREAIKYLKEALRELPEAWELWLLLAHYLSGSIIQSADPPTDSMVREGVQIYRRIVKYCTSAKVNFDAQFALAVKLFEHGELDEAKQIALDFPTVIQSLALPLVTRGAEQFQYIQDSMEKYLQSYWQYSRFAAIPDTYIFPVHDDNCFGLSVDERIAVLEGGLKALELLEFNSMPQESVGHYLGSIHYNYRSMAVLELSRGNSEQCLAYLEQAADYALKGDAGSKGDLLSHLTRNDELRWHCYDSIRDSERFNAIVERLKV
jgi:transcriptional regulator with XRE-family HTH domain